jgi:hypothetical protein
MPVPVGAVITIEPVATEHVGCVVFTVGADGPDGAAVIETGNPFETHPAGFLTDTT